MFIRQLFNSKWSVALVFVLLVICGTVRADDIVEGRIDDIINDFLENYVDDPANFGGRIKYAMVALHKGEDVATANYYINWVHDNYNIPYDSYWGFDLYGAMSLLFRTYLDPVCNSNLSPSARDDLEDIFWRLIKYRSLVSDAERSVWNILSSENHHVRRVEACFLATKALKEAGSPYSDDSNYYTLGDTKTIEKHYQAWKQYWFEYFRQRAREGVHCEIASPGYADDTIPSYYNIYDFSGSDELKLKAENFITLHWADTASDYLQATTIRGGAETRCYKDKYAMSGRYPFGDLLYCYDWHDTDRSDDHLIENVLMAMSSYRVPAIVTACAAATNKAPFLYTSRRFGRVNGVVTDYYDVVFDANHNSSLR